MKKQLLISSLILSTLIVGCGVAIDPSSPILSTETLEHELKVADIDAPKVAQETASMLLGPGFDIVFGILFPDDDDSKFVELSDASIQRISDEIGHLIEDNKWEDRQFALNEALAALQSSVDQYIPADTANDVNLGHLINNSSTVLTKAAALGVRGSGSYLLAGNLRLAVLAEQHRAYVLDFGHGSEKLATKRGQLRRAANEMVGHMDELLELHADAVLKDLVSGFSEVEQHCNSAGAACAKGQCEWRYFDDRGERHFVPFKYRSRGIAAIVEKCWQEYEKTEVNYGLRDELVAHRLREIDARVGQTYDTLQGRVDTFFGTYNYSGGLRGELSVRSTWQLFAATYGDDNVKDASWSFCPISVDGTVEVDGRCDGGLSEATSLRGCLLGRTAHGSKTLATADGAPEQAPGAFDPSVPRQPGSGECGTIEASTFDGVWPQPFRTVTSPTRRKEFSLRPHATYSNRVRTTMCMMADPEAVADGSAVIDVVITQCYSQWAGASLGCQDGDIDLMRQNNVTDWAFTPVAKGPIVGTIGLAHDPASLQGSFCLEQEGPYGQVVYKACEGGRRSQRWEIVEHPSLKGVSLRLDGTDLCLQGGGGGGVCDELRVDTCDDDPDSESYYAQNFDMTSDHPVIPAP